MSTTIYRPYFYIIQHINSSKYYSGVKYGKDANPDLLLKSNGYHTSSSTIHRIILDEGLESFVIRKIKVFKTKDQALDYESRFLRRINAAFNDNFLNRSNNSINNLNTDWEKKKRTCITKYGSENAFQSENVKNKYKQTNLERYGFEYPTQSTDVKDKTKQTNLERCGFENPMQSEKVKEKTKQTNLERYGCESVFQNDGIKEKSKQSMVEKYGFSYATQIPEVKERIKQINLERYGFEYPTQSKDVKDKTKQTNLERYGFENVLQSNDIKDKVKKTNLERYGCENPMQSKAVKDKIKQKRIFLSNQPIALEIRKYKEKHSLKLGYHWVWKPQEVKEKLLEELKITYGEI